MDHTDCTVTPTVFSLSAAEESLLAEVTEHDVGALVNSACTTSTLCRVSAAGLTEFLSYEANSDVDHEAHVDRSEHCRLAPAKPKAAAPPPLVVTCGLTESSMAQAGDRGTTTRCTVRYSWNNDRYWPE